MPLVDRILLLGRDGSMLGCGTHSQLVAEGILTAESVHDDDDDDDDEKAKTKPDEAHKLANRRESDGRLIAAENRRQGMVQLSTYKVVAGIAALVSLMLETGVLDARARLRPRHSCAVVVGAGPGRCVGLQLVSHSYAYGRLFLIVDRIRYMAYWVQEQPTTRRLAKNNVLIYVLLVAAMVFIAVVRSMAFFKNAIRSAQHLHDGMFRAVVKFAPFPD